MAITLTTDQIRKVLQLPERPYEDPLNYDGTTYYDVTHREICSILSLMGTVSGSAFEFTQDTDYSIVAGVVAWNKPSGQKPDMFSKFLLDYTYSILSNDTASNAVSTAQMMVARALGSTFPYGQLTEEGIAWNDLATLGAGIFAAKECCVALQGSDIAIAQKGRRGGVLIDDSKKTADWQALAKDFELKYKQYLVSIRPRGMVRAYVASGRNIDRSVFGWVGDSIFEGLGIHLPYGSATWGGVI